MICCAAVNYLLLPIWICSKVFVTAAFLAVLIDGSEDFPIPCRAFCIGIGLTFANFGSMVAPYAVSLVCQSRVLKENTSEKKSLFALHNCSFAFFI